MYARTAVQRSREPCVLECGDEAFLVVVLDFLDFLVVVSRDVVDDRGRPGAAVV